MLVLFNRRSLCALRPQVSLSVSPTGSILVSSDKGCQGQWRLPVQGNGALKDLCLTHAVPLHFSALSAFNKSLQVGSERIK